MLNKKCLKFVAQLVDKRYVEHGEESLNTRAKQVQSVLSQRRMPLEGWDDLTIKIFLAELAAMDTNNFVRITGGGEREARIHSQMVAERHFHLGHGIGRSGDLGAIQPKAAGSSVIMKLTTALTLRCLKLSGMSKLKACLLVPTATGMALLLTFLALRLKTPSAKFVIWSRIDQKTCFKSIVSAGLQPVVVECIREGDELRTDVNGIRDAIERVGAHNVLCVTTTSSCFAPRAPDRLLEVARLCKETQVAHVINNAYGVQSSATCRLIDKAAHHGRVDVVVQSTDKNFMVPVGGSIIAGFSKSLIDDISKTYPGRASMSPVLDLLITLLSLGERGFLQLIREREEVFAKTLVDLKALCAKFGERVLHTPSNPISLAFTIRSVGKKSPPSDGAEQKEDKEEKEEKPLDFSYFGAMLFRRNVSGMRTVPPHVVKTICGHTFQGYGGHSSAFTEPYANIACAIGMTQKEACELLERLESCFKVCHQRLTAKETRKENT